MSPSPKLRIGELASRAGVPRATIQFYLREGLLPEPVKTSRTMAYYDPECVERLLLIKELQRRYLPLNVIRELVSAPAPPVRSVRDGMAKLAEASAHVQRALEPAERALDSSEVAEQTGVRPEILDALEEIGIVQAQRSAPGRVTYSPSDVAILRAIGKLRATGVTEEAGFRVDDLALYRDAMNDLLAKEIAIFSRAMPTSRSANEVATLGIAATTGATELMCAIRNKLIAEFARALPLETPKPTKPKKPSRKHY